MNKLVIAIVAVLVVFVGWNVVSKSKQNNSDNIYKLGIILPMTGDAAVYGEPMLNVYKLAVDKINAKGGINGNKLELVLEDGKCTGSNSASAATKLVNVDKVQVILGGFCSSESLASIPSAEAGKVAIVSGGSSSPDLTGKSIFFSRTYPSDSSQGSVLAQIAYDQGVRKVYATCAGDTECMAREIKDTKNYAGVSGNITVDPKDNSVTKPTIFKVVKDGQFVEVK